MLRRVRKMRVLLPGKSGTVGVERAPAIVQSSRRGKVEHAFRTLQRALSNERKRDRARKCLPQRVSILLQPHRTTRTPNTPGIERNRSHHHLRSRSDRSELRRCMSESQKDMLERYPRMGERLQPPAETLWVHREMFFRPKPMDASVHPGESLARRRRIRLHAGDEFTVRLF